MKDVRNARSVLTDPSADANEQIKAAHDSELYSAYPITLEVLIEAIDFQIESSHGYGPVQVALAKAISIVAKPGDDRALRALMRLKRAAGNYKLANEAIVPCSEGSLVPLAHKSVFRSFQKQVGVFPI